jgi:CheY-like chemotaxis protein
MVANVRIELQQSASPLDVFAAVEGQIVEVAPSRPQGAARQAGEFQAKMPIESALAKSSVLLGVADTKMAAVLSEAIQAEGIHTTLFSGIDEARTLIAKDRPSLAILEHDPPRIDGMDRCRAIRRYGNDDEHRLPVVMVAGQEDPDSGAAAGVTDWLIKPFTSAYARTKIRTWVMRTACRWIRGPVPADEERRLASLRALQILDTGPDERFDRITRLAAALFNAPIALVSLVDENRQWFKSCYGLNVKETSRDAAFCAHVVYDRKPMVVSDTFLDARFAENPLVISEPRIRFYAGYPLILDDGACIGTLCIIDTRPRSLEGADLARLRDLADLAVREIREMNAVELLRRQNV